jgi:hypothetical protein
MQASKNEITEIAMAVALAVSVQEKDSMAKTNVKLLGTIAGILISFAALHSIYFMPSIREDTRAIINERVERIEREKVDVDVFQMVLERLTSIERKLDKR